eukprot:Gb_23919 [translate_table: standard]
MRSEGGVSSFGSLEIEEEEVEQATCAYPATRSQGSRIGEVTRENSLDAPLLKSPKRGRPNYGKNYGPKENKRSGDRVYKTLGVWDCQFPKNETPIGGRPQGRGDTWQVIAICQISCMQSDLGSTTRAEKRRKQGGEEGEREGSRKKGSVEERHRGRGNPREEEKWQITDCEAVTTKPRRRSLGGHGSEVQTADCEAILRKPEPSGEQCRAPNVRQHSELRPCKQVTSAGHSVVAFWYQAAGIKEDKTAEGTNGCDVVQAVMSIDSPYEERYEVVKEAKGKELVQVEVTIGNPNKAKPCEPSLCTAKYLFVFEPVTESPKEGIYGATDKELATSVMTCSQYVGVLNSTQFSKCTYMPLQIRVEIIVDSSFAFQDTVQGYCIQQFPACTYYGGFG